MKVLETVGAYKNDRPKLIRELKRIVREGQKSGDAVAVGAAYCHLADAYSRDGDLNGMLASALKAVALLKDTNEYELIVRAHFALSYVYGVQDNHQMSIAECDRAYQIIKRHRIKGKLRISVLNNLANAYHALRDYKTSIRILTRCIEQTETDFPNDYTSLAKYSINLASNCKSDGDIERARAILASMSEWIDRADFRPIVCDWFLRRALIAYELGDAESGDGFVDEAFARVPEDIYPGALYDDFRKVSRFLVARGDRARAGRILGLMTVYAEKETGPLERLCAYGMMADYYNGFGETGRALEYYIRLEKLYEERLEELTCVKLNIYKSIRNADAEIRRLRNKMRKNEELFSLEPMTRLLNRSALLALSSEYIASAAKKKQKVGAIFIDIDFFKECNDTYGHARGDEIIRSVAEACRAEENANVRFARYGGDEFFGVTRGLSDEAVADVARRVCRRVRGEAIPNEKNPNGGIITLSAGVVNVPITDRTDTIIEIANYADKALYRAKNSGKNAIFTLGYDGRGKNGASFAAIDF